MVDNKGVQMRDRCEVSRLNIVTNPYNQSLDFEVTQIA